MSAQPQEIWNLAPMSAEQLPQILEIERHAYEFPWSEGIFRDCLQVGYSTWVVSNATGDILAYAVMSMAAGEAHILNLCTRPDQQRHGLGGFLLQHLKRLARSARMEQLLLEVRPSNTAGIALYRNAGFHQVGLRKAYYPARDGREDALLFNCDLK
ncbi:MAG: ribosomal protein S18-alanine N-acetyltransferase [Pseudomonadota bacterium]